MHEESAATVLCHPIQKIVNEARWILMSILTQVSGLCRSGNLLCPNIVSCWMRPKCWGELANCPRRVFKIVLVKRQKTETVQNWRSTVRRQQRCPQQLARDNTTVATRRSCEFKRYKCRKYLLIRKPRLDLTRLTGSHYRATTQPISRSKCKMPGKG